jgi:3-oxoadipate CoA-transferase, beta subunit
MSAKSTAARVAWRAAQDVADGAHVDLGIRFPEMAAPFQPSAARRSSTRRTENGIFGFGEAPPAGEQEWDVINAGRKPVTLEAGTAFFHHADPFAMVRGGPLDVAILSAYGVAETAGFANRSTKPTGVPAAGGAMDLVHGAKRVAAITDHVTKDGKPKFVKRCSLPLTDVACVTRAHTGLAVIDIEGGRSVLRGKLPWRRTAAADGCRTRVADHHRRPHRAGTLK